MQRSLKTLIQLAAGLLCAVAVTAQSQTPAPKVNPTGTWKWSTTNQNGQARETILKLKLEGEKLTGTISGRQQDTEITEAKLKGNEIAFQVVREFNGNKMTSKYTGKISGDTIKGKTESDRNGEATTREWEAKRETAKPAEPAKK